MNIRRGEPLARHTTFRIGGPAEIFAEPADLSEARELLRSARGAGQPVLVLGAGSNLLVRDEGFPGLVISTCRLDWLAAGEGGLSAGGGVRISALMGYVVKYGLGGLEFLAGIPGTLGGALVMNAGVAGREIGSVVRLVTVLDENLAERELPAGAAGFGYRSSSLSAYPLVAGARLALEPRPPAAVRADIGDQVRRRRRTQPYGLASAGSVFKNPPGDYAGRLIEAAGCKGWRDGDALVSERHANFIVNTGAASARQVLALIERVRTEVRSRFGVELELEIKIV